MDFDEIAERIIRKEGAAFALAVADFTAHASAIATSVRWWLGILLVFLAFEVLSPFVERKWPFSQEPIVIVSAPCAIKMMSE